MCGVCVCGVCVGVCVWCVCVGCVCVCGVCVCVCVWCSVLWCVLCVCVCLCMCVVCVCVFVCCEVNKKRFLCDVCDGNHLDTFRRSQWPRCLRHRSTAAHQWECGFQCQMGHGCLSVVSVVCCQTEVSVTGRSLVQRSRKHCDASLCVI